MKLALVLKIALALGIGAWLSAFARPVEVSSYPQQIVGIDLTNSVPRTLAMEVADRRFRATVVVFLSAQCPCSRNHHEELNRLATQYSKRKFQFIGVHSNANEGFEESVRFFSRPESPVLPSPAKLVFPVIHDPESQYAKQLGALMTPHVFVLDSKRQVLFQGGVDDSHDQKRANKHYLENALRAIAANEPLNEKEKDVRVLGCQIQRP